MEVGFKGVYITRTSFPDGVISVFDVSYKTILTRLCCNIRHCNIIRCCCGVVITWKTKHHWPPIGKIAAHSAYDMFHGISA